MSRPGPKRQPLEPRLWAKIDRRGPDECWPWLGAKTPSGYGNIGSGGSPQHGGKTLKAHRVVCELTHGPAPGPEYDAGHTCDNRECCNPAHLKWEHHSENTSHSRFIDACRAGAAQRIQDGRTRGYRQRSAACSS